MIRSRLLPVVLCALAAAALTGCEKAAMDKLDQWMPGKPKPEDRWKPATAITDPVKIYQQNCLGCHSIGATTAAAIALNNPTYLAVIPPETLKGIITNGIPGSHMPAFIESKGGSLTDKQIEILTNYILSFKKPAAPGGVPPALPPYSAPLGNPAAGQAVYDAYVAALKKTVDPEMFTDGFMTNPAFVGMVSDQYLRSLIIAGQPEFGIPDYRSAIPGRPLTDQDIADVVAWLASQRKNEFGQPLAPSNP